MPQKPTSAKGKERITRREFLALLGVTTAGAGITCLGGTLGYWALDRLTDEDKTQVNTPAVVLDALRPHRLKEIDRPPVILRADWQAREPSHTAENELGFYSLTNVEGWREYEGDLRTIYRTAVVHHSVIYEEDDPSTMREIQNEHMDERKWADIGYHFGVGRSGQVFEGRDLKARGTHVEGFNTGSVGIVFFGNFEVEYPTQEQTEAGRRLIDWLALRLGLTHLAGHGEFNDFTVCPGAHMLDYLNLFAASSGLMHSTSGYQPPPEQITPTATP